MAKYTINFGDGTIKETDNLGESFEHKYEDGLDKHTIVVRGECGFNATLTEVQTTHKLDVTCDSTMGSVSGSGTYDEGSQVEVRCTPNSCHRFVQWSDGFIGNPRIIKVDSDMSLRAIMEVKQYSVKLSGDNCTLTGAGKYDCGKSVTITCKPADGYHFVQWNDGDTNPQKTFTITGNRTYTATCEKTSTAVCLPTISHSHSFTNIGGFAVNSTCSDVYVSMPQSSKWVANSFGMAITNDGNFVVYPEFSTDTITYAYNEEKITATSTMFKSGTLLNIHAATSSTIKAISTEPAKQPRIYINLIDKNGDAVDSKVIVSSKSSLEQFNSAGIDFTLKAYSNCVGVMISFHNVTFSPTHFTISITK